MQNHTHDAIEQNIANELFLSHGKILLHESIDGVRVGCDVNKHLPTKHGSFYASGPMYTRISIGYYAQDRESHYKPAKSTGDYNYKKIADRLSEMHTVVVARNARDAARRSIRGEQEDVLSKLHAWLHDDKYHGSFGVTGKVASTIKLTRPLSATQAEGIAKYMKESGLF